MLGLFSFVVESYSLGIRSLVEEQWNNKLRESHAVSPLHVRTRVQEEDFINFSPFPDR